MDDLSKEDGKRRAFVYISGSRGLPFVGRYLSTKLEAEQFLLSRLIKIDLDNIDVSIIRPGFIYSMKDKPVLMPLKYVVDVHAAM